MKRIFLIVFCCFSFISSAQIRVVTPLVGYLNDIISNIPEVYGADNYQPATSQQLTTFVNIVNKINDGNLADAHTDALTLGYKLIEIVDQTHTPEKISYVLKSSSTNYWGTFVFRPDAKRKQLILEAPHPLYDSNTGKQSSYIYDKVDAYMLYISGTHRCNSTEFTTCSGWTKVCGSDWEHYRISDPAHSTETTLQRVTETLEGTYDSLIYIQLHGFSKGSSDPYIIMSNSSQATPQGPDYLTQLSNALYDLDNVLTFKIAHIDQSWTRLIALTNVQGRLVNGSPEPCGTESPKNTGRFLHLEQAYSRLRSTQSNWQKVANAIMEVFPETNVTSIANTRTEVTDTGGLTIYPNPSNSSTNLQFQFNETQFVNVTLYNSLGQKIKVLFNREAGRGEYKLNLNGTNLSSGVYYVVMKSKAGIVSRKFVLLK